MSGIFVDDTDPPYDPTDECEFDDEIEDDWFLNFVCGMMPDGQCGLAGTEECDWKCPRRI